MYLALGRYGWLGLKELAFEIRKLVSLQCDLPVIRTNNYICTNKLQGEYPQWLSLIPPFCILFSILRYIDHFWYSNRVQVSEGLRNPVSKVSQLKLFERKMSNKKARRPPPNALPYVKVYNQILLVFQ